MTEKGDKTCLLHGFPTKLSTSISHTQSLMFRPRLRIPRPPRLGVSVQSRLLPLACQARSQHTLRPLEYPTDQGIPGFLSAASLNISWTQYQTFLLQKLNALIAGMSLSPPASPGPRS